MHGLSYDLSPPYSIQWEVSGVSMISSYHTILHMSPIYRAIPSSSSGFCKFLTGIGSYCCGKPPYDQVVIFSGFLVFPEQLNASAYINLYCDNLLSGSLNVHVWSPLKSRTTSSVANELQLNGRLWWC